MGSSQFSPEEPGVIMPAERQFSMPSEGGLGCIICKTRTTWFRLGTVCAVGLLVLHSLKR